MEHTCKSTAAFLLSFHRSHHFLPLTTHFSYLKPRNYSAFYVKCCQLLEGTKGMTKIFHRQSSLEWHFFYSSTSCAMPWHFLYIPIQKDASSTLSCPVLKCKILWRRRERKFENQTEWLGSDAYRGQCNFSSNSKDTFLPLYPKKVAFLSERKLSLRKLYFTEEKFTLRRESELSLRKVHFPLEKCTFPS